MNVVRYRFIVIPMGTWWQKNTLENFDGPVILIGLRETFIQLRKYPFTTVAELCALITLKLQFANIMRLTWNKPFYNCLLSYVACECERGWR